MGEEVMVVEAKVLHTIPRARAEIEISVEGSTTCDLCEGVLLERNPVLKIAVDVPPMRHTLRICPSCMRQLAIDVTASVKKTGQPVLQHRPNTGAYASWKTVDDGD